MNDIINAVFLNPKGFVEIIAAPHLDQTFVLDAAKQTHNLALSLLDQGKEVKALVNCTNIQTEDPIAHDLMRYIIRDIPTKKTAYFGANPEITKKINESIAAGGKTEISNIFPTRAEAEAWLEQEL